MTGRYEVSSTKMWVLVANWFGVITSVIALGGALFLLLTPNEISITQTGAELQPADVTIYTLLLFFGAYSLASCAFIINFTRKTDDATFINNRYVLVLFSLSTGGIFTPFILSRLPNIDVKTSLTPRVTISQGFAVTFVTAGVPTFAYLAANVNWSNLFTNTNGFETANQVILFVALAAMLWGLINFSLFFGKSVHQRYEESGLRGLMFFVSTINLLLATLILIWMLILAILNMISLIGQLFQRRDGFLSSLFNSVIISFKIAVQMFVIYTTWKCIFGIWAKNNFEYSRNASFAEKEQQYISL